MKQLTNDQISAIYQSGAWENWTDEEIVKVQLFQSRLCIPFDKFYVAIGMVFGRIVSIDEFAVSNQQKLINEYKRKRREPTFEEIMALLPKDKFKYPDI